MSISYDYYKVFYYVATYHSINKAANVLSCSQPGISRTISSLETQLGSKLFNRSSTGVTLTEAGNDLLAHIEPAFRHIRAAEEEIRFARELKRGILTLGISTGLTRGVIEELLVPPIDSFHKQFPDVRMEVVYNSTPILVSEIKNGLLDIAFITLDQRGYINKNDNHPKILYSYNDIAIAGIEYSHIAKRKISITQLEKYPIIGLGENTDTFQYYKDIFSDFGLEYRPAVKTISTGQILVHAIGNFGIGFTHPKDAMQAIKDGRLVQIKLKEKLPKRNISMIKNTKEKQSCIAFEQILNAHINDLNILENKPV